MALVNIHDFRDLARRRLPKIFFDYIDGGSFEEETMRANRSDFSRITLRQKVLVEPQPQDLSTAYLGKRHPLPFMLGPVGFLGLYSGKGEVKAVQAAHAAGIPFCLSTFSIASLADLRTVTEGPLHFQLYVLEDRSLCEELLQAAEQAGVRGYSHYGHSRTGCAKRLPIADAGDAGPLRPPRAEAALARTGGPCRHAVGQGYRAPAGIRSRRA
jgi:isopentenyl diphosphate isomerase/L-lactate dehydrogenase-like FMN-dependent dehydrogenase